MIGAINKAWREKQPLFKMEHNMKTLHTFKIWFDGKKDEAITIVAENMTDALDFAAQDNGHSCYSDMMTERGWWSEEGDGLNIVDMGEEVE